MKTTRSYSLEIWTHLSFLDAIRRVTERLAEEGFGVLTEVDVQATLKKKLGLETKPYRILGACNPSYAHRALAAEPHVGVLLPCNVVVWGEGSYRVVAAMEPRVIAAITDSPEFRRIAEEVSARIRRVIEHLAEDTT